jgi:hypothetical protein
MNLQCWNSPPVVQAGVEFQVQGKRKNSGFFPDKKIFSDVFPAISPEKKSHSEYIENNISRMQRR